jgi:hypothetical protein
MADDVDPTKTLNTARDKLIEERRGLAVAIALGYRRRRTDDPHTNESRAAFIDVQNLIEAIDRAIADEKLIGCTRPAPSMVPALEAAVSVAPRFVTPA